MMNQKLDVPLSEHVAKEASHQINKLSNELNENKDSYIYFLKDVLNDMREHSKFLKRVIASFFIVTVVLICGMVSLNLYNQRLIKTMASENNARLMDFIESTDFYYEVELSNESSDYNTNSLNVTK